MNVSLASHIASDQIWKWKVAARIGKLASFKDQVGYSHGQIVTGIVLVDKQYRVRVRVSVRVRVRAREYTLPFFFIFFLSFFF